MPNLILTRRKKESVKVVIDGKVIAEVTLVGGANAVQLGFEANPEVKFLRSEVWERMQKEGAK